jgi:hypothetical protein
MQCLVWLFWYYGTPEAEGKSQRLTSKCAHLYNICSKVGKHCATEVSSHNLTQVKDLNLQKEQE